MIARQLIYGASFVRPEALKAILEAFDAVWAEIAGNFGNDTLTIEAARLKLATALVTIASEGSRDVEVLKKAATRMALDYWKRTLAPAPARLAGRDPDLEMRMRP